jgi:adenosylhomocysteine nucleosidase
MHRLVLSFLFVALVPLSRAEMPPAPPGGWWAVCGAYAGEMRAIREQVQGEQEIATVTILGSPFVFAEVHGRKVVFFETGVSMVNAAMMLQAAFERIPVRAVIFAGVAGGIDPGLDKGDVVVPAEWYHHGEAAYYNETAPGSGEYVRPVAEWAVYPRGNFGMIHPTPTWVRLPGHTTPQRLELFPADPGLLEVARATAAAMPGLRRHDGTAARVEVGGAGVAGMVFMDNRQYREFVFQAWGARCLDMESSALAQVALINGKPILIIRALSDLAGGQEGVNHFEVAGVHAEDNAARFLDQLLRRLPE